MVRLAREVPYPEVCLRSVTLLCAAGRLFADVTAEVAVGDHGVDPARVAGVDLGIIHPFAVVGQVRPCWCRAGRCVPSATAAIPGPGGLCMEPHH